MVLGVGQEGFALVGLLVVYVTTVHERPTSF